MRKEEYLQGILGALGVGEDKGVPDPVWRHEEYLKAIYDKLKEGGGSLPPVTEADNGKVMAVIDGEWEPSLIPIDDEKIEQFVDAWLDDHPEATTTVQDGAITRAKLAAALAASFAEDYSSEKTYPVIGTYVWHSGALYKNIVSITTAEAWTAAHWTAVTLGDDIGDLKSAIAYSENILHSSSIFVYGGTDPTTGEFVENTTNRCRTGYLPVKEYAVIANNKQSDFEYWIRCYDSSKEYIGTCYNDTGKLTTGTSASVEDLLIYDILDVRPTTAYIVIGVRKKNNGNFTPAECDFTVYKKGAYERYIYKPELENGLVLNNGAISTAKNDWANIGKYYRTSKFINVGGNAFIMSNFQYNVTSVTYIEYDENYEFIKYTNRSLPYYIKTSETTKYVKIRLYYSSGFDSSIIHDYSIKITSKEELKANKNIRTSAGWESLLFRVKENAYSSCALKLPTNYSNNGEPVPMIVWNHGSGAYTAINTETFSSESYENLYNFLRDNGFAVLLVYCWSSDIATSGTSTWGTPSNMKCLEQGISFVINNYNIDKENLFIGAKSLGGITAAELALQNKFNFRAAGLLAPELDMLQPQPFGYNQGNRVAIATDFDFDGDWQSVLNVSNDDFEYNAAYSTLMTNNAMKMAGNIPTWMNFNLPIATKVSNSLSHIYNSEQYRYMPVPLKIWIAQDDSAVSYNQASAFVSTIKNYGGNAELRTMASGTGGHSSVDTGENAPQTTNVTTILGVLYETVPTAFYELVNYYLLNIHKQII